MRTSIDTASSLDRLISDRARDCSKTTFLMTDEGSLTFGDIDTVTRAVQSDLLGAGVRVGDRVAILMRNHLFWPLVWLAILRTGAIAVPINFRYQSEDLTFVLNDSGARFLVCDRAEDGPVADAIAHSPSLECILTIDGTFHAPSLLCRRYRSRSRDVGEPLFETRVSNLQYTSGTTGFPKACILSEDYWMLMGTLTSEAAEIVPGDVTLTAQPFSYIDPQWQTMMCLTSGTTLVILPKFVPSTYWSDVCRYGATFLYLVGSMPVLLYKQGPTEWDRSHRLRMVLASGINPDLHQAFEDRWGVPWREVFGMTETGIDLVAGVSDTDTVGSGIAGRPVATKQARIVDDHMVEMPCGRVGELVVKGQPMMEGYFNRPLETAETIKDGWLRTGDLATQDRDGWVRIVGRRKDMVRRGGENISAVEVEAVLNRHPKVRLSAVVPVEDELMGEEVMAYVQVNDGLPGSSLLAQELTSYTRNRLASFKVPRYIHFVEDFPRTPSERIAKKELVEVFGTAGSFDTLANTWI